ncbi:GNAT family N-acetyltransferase [Aquibium carbonis]|uniref:GNAT family N-acetyltransferase n=1 Tax=Aquibium carbonis TaxID=2495581 RepID=A0A429YXU3_9HYPH|nr:GNAT family N-acetyltransferase [Aquibium carbonis]RST86261.1 GNAT family N-acetyltransferase [Aquibium carbonis]
MTADLQDVDVRPLTFDLWPALEDLFGPQGACYGCWCSYFRLPPARRRAGTRETNKAHLQNRVEAGPPPGLIAFEDRRPVGWMQIGPRADVPEWNNARRVSAPLEGENAAAPSGWAISCFFIRSKARGKGLSHRLVAEGILYARQNGARILDACPIDEAKQSKSVGLFVGSTRIFEAAGFRQVALRKPGRPLMRLEL